MCRVSIMVEASRSMIERYAKREKEDLAPREESKRSDGHGACWVRAWETQE
jgi:hypothetical protein